MFHKHITFALSLLAATLSSADNLCISFDLDQDQQNVGPDLDPNRLTLSADNYKSMENYPACKELQFLCFREFIHV